MSDPTQEMLDAGADALLDALGTCNPGPLFHPGVVVADIYAAMRALEPKGVAKSAIALKLDASDLERCLAEFAETVAEFKAAVEAATTEE